MPKLTKNNTYAILWLKSQGWELSEISKELGITDKQVNSVVLPQPIESVNNIRRTSKDFMINQTANKTRGVSIMTKEASAMNDDLKKTTTKNNNSRINNSIHKIS